MAGTLVDTNILLRLLQPQHPQYSIAITALDGLRGQAADLCIAAQNLVEFWVVASRPVVNNGLGMSSLSISAEMRRISGLFRLLEGKAGVASVWERIVSRHAVLGKQAHDAHLVAVMQIYGMTDILTFNVVDFGRYPGITVLDPASI